MAKVKRICECGHPESDHSDYGFRRCARQSCPCDQYLEDDDPIEWNPPRLGAFNMGLQIVLIVAGLVFLARCIGAEPMAPTPAVPMVDTTGKDSGTVPCPGSCECWPDGTIKKCPDPRPPAPPKKKAAPEKTVPVIHVEDIQGVLSWAL